MEQPVDIMINGISLRKMLALHNKWERKTLFPLFKKGRQLDLSGKDISYVNLKGVNLNKAVLCNVKFYHSNLSKVNLNEANLKNSRFLNVDLTEANLAGADLSGANFMMTNLTGANLSKADLQSCIICGDRFKKFHSIFGGIIEGLTNSKIRAKKIENIENSGLESVDFTDANIDEDTRNCLLLINKTVNK